ncbi:MAG: P-loop NTPase [Candidatus Aenigmarchaeota archaeon]|nr:P-loop NTPase [Candidatus Aenigmarchaeota archaeon]
MTRVIGIVSGKGGIGKTTFAVNLGIALSRFRKKVLIIDCNITTPHVAYYLGVDNYSINLSNVFRDEVDIKFAPTSHDGVLFIPASEELKDMNIEFERLNSYIKKLSKKGNFDFIILDSAPGLGNEAVSVLRTAEEILLVTTPAIPNLTDMIRCAEYLSGMKDKKIKIVFNMIRKSKSEVKMKDLESFFDVPILGSVPFTKDVMDSTALGIPIFDYKPKSKVCHDFMEVAANLIGVEYKKPSKIKRFVGKLIKR